MTSRGSFAYAKHVEARERARLLSSLARFKNARKQVKCAFGLDMVMPEELEELSEGIAIGRTILVILIW